METDPRIQAIQGDLKTLNELAAKVNQTITHEKANNYLQGLVRNYLRDVESLLVPWARDASTPADASMFLDMADFELGQTAARLNYAQELVTKYGTGIEAIAG